MQDIGLTDENDNSIDIPPWLINDNVRAGIRALLDYNRCEEEEKRLKQERYLYNNGLQKNGLFLMQLSHGVRMILKYFINYLKGKNNLLNFA